MKTIKHCIFSLSFMLIVIMGLNSCTQVDGHIGVWFGSWALESIECEGEKDENFRKDIIISFQSDIYNLCQVDYCELYGSWKEEGSVLTLTPAWGAATVKEWPSQLHWGTTQPCTFKILQREHKCLKLQLACPDGKVRVYTFRHIL